MTASQRLILPAGERGEITPLWRHPFQATRSAWKLADSHPSGAPPHDRSVMFHGGTGASSENALLGGFYGLKLAGIAPTLSYISTQSARSLSDFSGLTI